MFDNVLYHSFFSKKEPFHTSFTQHLMSGPKQVYLRARLLPQRPLGAAVSNGAAYAGCCLILPVEVRLE